MAKSEASSRPPKLHSCTTKYNIFHVPSVYRRFDYSYSSNMLLYANADKTVSWFQKGPFFLTQKANSNLTET